METLSNQEEQGQELRVVGAVTEEEADELFNTEIPDAPGRQLSMEAAEILNRLGVEQGADSKTVALVIKEIDGKNVPTGYIGLGVADLGTSINLNQPPERARADLQEAYDNLLNQNHPQSTD